MVKYTIERCCGNWLITRYVEKANSLSIRRVIVNSDNELDAFHRALRRMTVDEEENK